MHHLIPTTILLSGYLQFEDEDAEVQDQMWLARPTLRWGILSLGVFLIPGEWHEKYCVW